MARHNFSLLKSGVIIGMWSGTDYGVNAKKRDLFVFRRFGPIAYKKYSVVGMKGWMGVLLSTGEEVELLVLTDFAAKNSEGNKEKRILLRRDMRTIAHYEDADWPISRRAVDEYVANKRRTSRSKKQFDKRYNKFRAAMAT